MPTVPSRLMKRKSQKAIEKAFSGGGGDETGQKIEKHYRRPVELNVAHIQITDHLALGALKHRITTGDLEPQYFDLSTQLMGG